MVKNDISNKTILILVVLTVIVSTLGTLTVLDSVYKVNAEPVPVGSTSDLLLLNGSFSTKKSIPSS